MPRIPDSDLQRLKQDISVQRLVEASGVELKRQGISGQCTVQFFVDENGVVSDPVVISASHEEFKKPSLDAVMQWRFSPGMKNGRKVATRMQQQFPYKLN